MKLFGTFLIVITSSVVSAQFLNCDWVQSLDCTTYDDFPECGTDGLQYKNRCYFAKAQCIDKYLHILHDGPCSSTESSTTSPSPGVTVPDTPAPTTVDTSVDGELAVLDFFCTVLSKQPCGNETQLVCATDGWTYDNYCEYDKARCTHRDLHVATFGQCP